MCKCILYRSAGGGPSVSFSFSSFCQIGKSWWAVWARVKVMEKFGGGTLLIIKFLRSLAKNFAFKCKLSFPVSSHCWKTSMGGRGCGGSKDSPGIWYWPRFKGDRFSAEGISQSDTCRQ